MAQTYAVVILSQLVNAVEFNHASDDNLISIVLSKKIKKYLNVSIIQRSVFFEPTSCHNYDRTALKTTIHTHCIYAYSVIYNN